MKSVILTATERRALRESTSAKRHADAVLYLGRIAKRLEEAQAEVVAAELAVADERRQILRDRGEKVGDSDAVEVEELEHEVEHEVEKVDMVDGKPSTVVSKVVAREKSGEVALRFGE